MLKYAIAHLQHVETDFNRRTMGVSAVLASYNSKKIISIFVNKIYINSLENVCGQRLSHLFHR